MPRLNVKEAAQYIPCSPSTLNKYRVTGGGPPFIKLLGKILYETDDIDVWLKASKQTSTSATPKKATGG